jgi:PAS domain S-box-containing protein
MLIGLGLIVALLIGSAALTYRNTRQLYEDAHSVVHTHEVLDQTSEILVTLIDAETAERTYVLTGRLEYLKPYDESLVRLDQCLTPLNEKTKDNDLQQERMKQLETMTAKWRASMQKLINLRRSGARQAQPYFDLAREGQEQMDGIRQLVTTMEGDERDLLIERQRRSDRAYQVAVITGLATALLGLVMIGAFVRLLNRSLRTRQKAAAVVQEQREWLQTTLASIGDAVIATDTEGRVTFLNGVAEALTGWKQSEAQGQDLQTVFRILNEDSRRPAENPALRALREGQIVGLANHSVLVARDGTERPVDDSAAPIRDDKGRVAGAVLTFRDITERRRLEKEVCVRLDELADADQKKNEFLAMLAHELRNPLAPISNALQVLRVSGGRSPEPETRAFAQMRDVMERQLAQMVRLIDDLLDVSRISRGKIDLRMERLDVTRVVECAVETSRPLLEEARHELIVTVPPEPVYVTGDLTRLGQVLSNLLNNSAKYTPEAGRIELTVERQGGHAVIRVRDNGAGIPGDVLPRIFELFNQADHSLRRSHGGLGIGLTLARRLVEMHSGTIDARSDGAGMGSEFVVRLPLATEEVLPRPAKPTDGHEVVGRAPTRRILVVDDNEDSTESLATLLKLLGHEVRTAYDGSSALAAARDFRPDVVLLDIGMPGMTGYDVARAMREMPEVRDAVLVAQTGWGQDEDRRRSADAGFDHHLVKPVDLADLQLLLHESGRPAA